MHSEVVDKNVPELAATPLLGWTSAFESVAVSVKKFYATYSCCTLSLAKTPLGPPVGGQLDVPVPRNQR